tara:strand:- start:10142 stop:11191 length:1050 start_codon:yes stop_codon:yes gene_type:complete
MSILITGAGGFIGYHLCKKLLELETEVVGFDNLNSYYDVNLKKARIKDLEKYSSQNKAKFHFVKGDLTNKEDLKSVFNGDFIPELDNSISIVINLAAQAGVRYSIENPSAYVQSNIVGFCNLIEESKEKEISHFIYASSSSVYGGNRKLPFEETDNVDKPISLYAATKKSNELIAHTYSHLFNLPTTGLRFFTVYGPWGRPDMALFKFTDLIIKNKPIKVFNFGKMIRDFTYIDDVIQSILCLINKSPHQKNSFEANKNIENYIIPYKIFNVGNSQPTNLTDYIDAIEKKLQKKAKIIFEEMQPGDVEATYANTDSLEKWINFKPSTSIEKGIEKFIEWYLSYYRESEY